MAGKNQRAGRERPLAESTKSTWQSRARPNSRTDNCNFDRLKQPFGGRMHLPHQLISRSAPCLLLP